MMLLFITSKSYLNLTVTPRFLRQSIIFSIWWRFSVWYNQWLWNPSRSRDISFSSVLPLNLNIHNIRRKLTVANLMIQIPLWFLLFVTLWIASSCYEAASSYRIEGTCCWCCHTFGIEWLQILILSLLIELVLRIAFSINVGWEYWVWWNRSLVLPRSKEFIHPSAPAPTSMSADFTR